MSLSAAARPAGPPPTITTSNSRTSLGGRAGDVENELDDDDTIIADDERATTSLSNRLPPRPALRADARREERILRSAMGQDAKREDAPTLESGQNPN